MSKKIEVEEEQLKELLQQNSDLKKVAKIFHDIFLKLDLDLSDSDFNIGTMIKIAPKVIKIVNDTSFVEQFKGVEIKDLIQRVKTILQ